MWPYVILLLVPLSIQHIKIKGWSYSVLIGTKNNRSMKAFWIILFLMLALRHESIGRDLKSYKIIFGYISKSSWPDALGRSAELGFNFLNKAVSSITDDFRWIMVISAVLSLVFMAIAYVRYSDDSVLSIVLFISISNFLLLFSGLRQSIAISIGFIAFELTRRKKLVWFLVTVAIAMMFHTSAFMIFLMYPVYHLKLTKKWLLAIIPILGFVFIFNQQIFGTLTFILSLFTKYDGEISHTGSYTMLVLFILFAVFSYVIPDEGLMDQDTIGMRNFLLLSVALQMFAPLHSIAMRMNYYYIIFIPLLIPQIIRCRSIRWNQVAVASRHVMVVFFILYFFMTAPSDNLLDTFPYRFMWEYVP